MIPLLTIDDIRKEAEPIYNKVLSEEGIAILQHEIETNRIAYVDLLFDISHIDAEEVPYLRHIDRSSWQYEHRSLYLSGTDR